VILRLLVLVLAASAGVHAALVPGHAAKSFAAGALFAVSALALAALALAVDRSDGMRTVAAAALLLCLLLAAYAATRVAVLWPFDHAEPVDVLGALTKLLEAAGLVLAVRLLHAQAGSHTRLSARTEGAGP
jgi:hypothetical protein